MRKSKLSFLAIPLLITGCGDSLVSLTGYTASMTCSKSFETDLNWQNIYDEDLNPITNGNVDLANVTIDTINKSVTSKAFTVSKTSVYRPGLGCTLLSDNYDVLQQPYPNREVTRGDGIEWPVGNKTSQSQSANYEKLNKLATAHFTEFKPYQVKSSSLAIVHDGNLIFEKYADNYTLDTPIYGFSIAKTVGTLFTGVLSDQGLLDINEPLNKPEWQGDARKDITIKNLLNMTSGLDFSETYDDPVSDANMLFVADDMAEFSSNQPLANTPGSAFNYSTGDSLIVAGEIKRILGGNLESSLINLNHNLLDKIGLNNSVVQADSSGTLVFGMQGLFSTHDLARLGQLLLQNGKWQGEQVVSTQWMDFMKTPVNLQNSLGYTYGAGIWLNKKVNGRQFLPSLPEDTMIAFGLRGQFVIACPSLNLVMVRTGSTLDAYDFIADMDDLSAGVIEAL